MNRKQLLNEAIRHLQVLCTDIGNRAVGSRGNRQATDYFRDQLRAHDWLVEETPLEVMDWHSDGASLECGHESFEVFSGPYSLGCSAEGELAEASCVEEIEGTGLHGKILLLHGAVAAEQVMPKNFVFYNPEEHRRIIAALEKSGVKALACATGRNAALAGGSYPFPLFEDGDFDIPNVYMKDIEGARLLNCVGRSVRLESRARRIPETAFNVLGRKGDSGDRRLVISAHIDAKKGSPGAIDNATGVAVLLLLAGLLKDYLGHIPVELVAFNGEDYYAAPGQMKYLEQHQGRFDQVLLNINIDGAGYKEGPSAFSPFGLDGAWQQAFDQVLQKHPTIIQGGPWYQGDHSIFLQAGRPAIAVTSAWFLEHLDTQDITHTPRDNPGIVEEERLVELALAIRDLVLWIH